MLSLSAGFLCSECLLCCVFYVVSVWVNLTAETLHETLEFILLFVTSNSKQSVTCLCDGAAGVKVLIYLLFYLFIYSPALMNQFIHQDRMVK